MHHMRAWPGQSRTFVTVLPSTILHILLLLRGSTVTDISWVALVMNSPVCSYALQLLQCIDRYIGQAIHDIADMLVAHHRRASGECIPLT